MLKTEGKAIITGNACTKSLHQHVVVSSILMSDAHSSLAIQL